VLESPSGSWINSLFIRSVSKHKHFWGEKFYLTLVMQGGDDIEYEHLSAAAADDLMKRIENLVDQSLSSATAYDEAYEGGRSQGYDSGYNNGSSEGYSNGYQEAKNAFWSHDREEYRINDYNVGYEAGKRDAQERTGERWNEGYNYGRDEAAEELGSKVSDLEAEVANLKSANRRWQQRAVRAEAAMTEPKQGDGSFSRDGKGRYSALRRSLAKLFHPDHSSGSSFEKAIRQELFKEIWSEIDIIEKRYTE
jgi:hypothetical protein